MKRYDCNPQEGGSGSGLCMDEDATGDWVLYEDVEPLLQAIINILYEVGPCDPDCSIEYPNECSYNAAEKLLPEGWREREIQRRRKSSDADR